MNKKAAIELSVNFLVIMLISIIIIILGFVLVNRVISSGTNEMFKVDDRLRAQIEDLLIRENRLVAIPIVEKSIDRGRGDFFGIGVMNLELYPQNFSVNVTFDKAFNRRTGSELTGTSNINDWIVLEDMVKIQARERYVFSVGFQVPRNVQDGLYIFNVSITNSTNIPESHCENHLNCYDKSIHKLYLLIN